MEMTFKNEAGKRRVSDEFFGVAVSADGREFRAFDDGGGEATYQVWREMVEQTGRTVLPTLKAYLTATPAERRSHDSMTTPSRETHPDDDHHRDRRIEQLGAQLIEAWHRGAGGDVDVDVDVDGISERSYALSREYEELIDEGQHHSTSTEGAVP